LAIYLLVVSIVSDLDKEWFQFPFVSMGAAHRWYITALPGRALAQYD
jgi:hypothetical protein